MYNVSNIRQAFIDLYNYDEYTIDRSGCKTLEILGASFIADEPAIFGKPNVEYIEKEIDWYDSMSTNIYDIDRYDDPPKAWVPTGNDWGEINSNYGYIIYSDRFYNQYENALQELIDNPNSRRATMIYTRPSIWVEAFENGKNDFICTNAVSYYIRDNKIHCVVQMRSNDVVFGYKNDRAWQLELLKRMCDDYNAQTYSFLTEDYVQLGDIHWQVQNLHVYERHFKFIK